MLPLTFRTILRDYADGIDGGAYDPDIESARERKFVALLLRTISNDERTNIPYRDVTSNLRADVLGTLWDRAWAANLGFFVEVASPTARELLGKAQERATEIVRNI